MFHNTYINKKVLITGHTGFKGSWLTSWLLKLGAVVVGISKDIPTQPAMFEELDLGNQIKSHQIDIRDLEGIKKIIKQERPDFIFHLAAQAIVSLSYSDPVETISSNVVGTMNILEALRFVDHECIAVLITSDKCYDNVEWIWGYRESDSLGGKDIYSGSKGAAELIIKSYLNSFFRKENVPVRIGIGRAGNVIGGGDWAKDRLVVDCVSSWANDSVVEIRSPMATRPWQHVLEPLSGYLTLGQSLKLDHKHHAEAFNFGPRSEQNRTVKDLISDMSNYWLRNEKKALFNITDNIPFHEANLLRLNCDKSLQCLKWESNLGYDETVEMVCEWYFSYYHKTEDIKLLTNLQIDKYESIGLHRGRAWSV